MSWTIEPFDRRHDRAGFSCGQPSLDAFLARYAGQYEKRRIGRTCVLVRDGGPRVYGYHTLVASVVRPEELPAVWAKGLPRLPVPTALLGRLAVDSSVRGQGLGKFLLMDALARVVLAANQLAVFAVTVDALDDEAARFYEKYGFICFPGQPDRLFLPLDTFRPGPGP